VRRFPTTKFWHCKNRVTDIFVVEERRVVLLAEHNKAHRLANLHLIDIRSVANGWIIRINSIGDGINLSEQEKATKKINFHRRRIFILLSLSLVSEHITNYSQARYISIIDGEILVWKQAACMRCFHSLT